MSAALPLSPTEGPNGYPREVETERLLLRQFRGDDFEPYLRIASNPDVRRSLHRVGEPSRDETWRSMAMLAGVWSIRGYGYWAVELRATGELIGRVGVWFPVWYPEIEAGWLIAREHWGSGYATEAGAEALRQAFGTLGVDHVSSLIHPDNAASRRVAEKLGGTLEKTFMLDGEELLYYGYTAPPR
jgi:RimJ/RimL family protein N-acetyltransferase